MTYRRLGLTIVDEFGRRIPNVDTSQGSKNNLYLEITLETREHQYTHNRVNNHNHHVNTHKVSNWREV